MIPERMLAILMVMKLAITADWDVFSPISAFLNVVINILNTTVSFVVFLGIGFAQLLMLVTALLSGLCKGCGFRTPSTTVAQNGRY